MLFDIADHPDLSPNQPFRVHPGQQKLRHVERAGCSDLTECWQRLRLGGLIG